jgi:hypothetical protein
VKYAANSALQLLTLFVGIGIGLLISPQLHSVVNAHTESGQAVDQSPAPASDSADSYKPKPVAPTITAPSLGANLILVHQLEADKAIVNGYDLLKIDEGIINYLASQPLANQITLHTIASSSRSADIHTIVLPSTSKPQAPPSSK